MALEKAKVMPPRVGFEWKICEKCGSEQSRLFTTGGCPKCRPEYLDPPIPVKKQEEGIKNIIKGGEPLKRG